MGDRLTDYSVIGRLIGSADMKKRHIGRISVSADFIGHIGLYTIGYILGISINEMLEEMR